MEQSASATFVDRLMESYQCARTGSIGVSHDWQRFIDLVAEAQADPELKDDVTGILNAKGLSLTQAKAMVVSGKAIRDAILAVFPLPVTEEG